MKTAITSAALLLLCTAHAQTVTRVTDINPGSASANITEPTIWNGRIYMGATTAANGHEPWSTNGTNSTRLEGDIYAGNQGSGPNGFLAGWDSLFFVARASVGYGDRGDRIYKIRTTGAGVTELPMTGSGVHTIRSIHFANNKLYASAGSGSNLELQAWHFGASVGGAYGGTTGNTVGGAYGGTTGNVGNAANPGTAGNAAGGLFGNVGGVIPKWTHLGTVRDINPNGGSDPQHFTTFNNKTYFTADNGTNGRELWVTDGTTTGTSMVKDINAGAGSSNPTQFTKLGNKLYFVANDGAKGRELWVTDGTTAGTLMVKDINTQRDAMSPIALGITSGSNPAGMTVWKNKLYFSATSGSPGTELWCSDGTAAGTVLLKDVKAGAAGSSPSELYALNTSTIAGTLSYTHYYYSAIGGNNGRELWEFHPLTNTHKKISPAVAPNTNPLGEAHNWPWVQMGNALYFYANYDSNGGELWKVTRP